VPHYHSGPTLARERNILYPQAPDDYGTPMTANKVACVTGSGRRRVGWHVAEALARRGYAVATHYHRSEVEAEEAVRYFASLGVEAAAFQADLTDEPATRTMFEQIGNRFGRLDVLVHCAAIWSPLPLEKTTSSDVRRFFEANALSAFMCAQQAGLRMAAQSAGGCIVLLGDWATSRPYRDHAAYFLSKGTIPTLTRVMAVELAERNSQVRVNCLLPGPVMMPSSVSPEERQRVIDATLVRREGRPENVAQAVLALVENDFITGACLPVDGGRSIFANDA
jgi:pteridine reductase